MRPNQKLNLAKNSCGLVYESLNLERGRM